MNYIFSHYTGDLNKEGIRWYLNSVNKNIKNCVVLFFTDVNEIPVNLQTYPNVKFIKGFETNLELLDCCKRYFYYYEYIINNNFLPSDKFFIGDVRDLVFLDDIFDRIFDNNQIHLFQENSNVILKDEQCNTMWLNDMDTNLVNIIGHNPICCSGTTICENLNMIKSYLHDLTRLMLRYEKKSKWKINDQGIHNELVYTTNNFSKLKKENLNFHKNENPNLIYTMGLCPESEYVIESNNLYVGESKIKPAVIHQYDRRDRAKNFVIDMFN